ncbi:MAG: hypothetical protein WAN08_03655 [Candidatus Sulfotelmatobacter sp.]
MVAAGAAGMGILALAVPSQAKVVYTPDNQQITPNQGLSLDLNHDGIADFVFSDFYSSTSSTLDLSIGPVNPSNEIFSTGRNVLSVFAAALPAGVVIGPHGKFEKKNGEGMADGFPGVCQGPWIHAHEKYLGLKFIIDGEIHFGWARLNVNCVYPKPIIATLTGYAFETVANQPIVAGETKGPDASDDPGTLGNLARGAAAISNWRNQQTTDEIH